MILGIDHIALSCRDIFAGEKALRQLGYAAQFFETYIPNPIEKTALLKNYQPRHSLAYCKGAAGIHIELTQHSAPLETAETFYEILFQGAGKLFSKHPAPDDLREIWRLASKKEIFPVLWEAMNVPLWQTPASDPAGVCAIAFPVSRLKDSADFWVQGLGARTVGSGKTALGTEWQSLKISSPIPSWTADILLHRHEGMRKPMLDDNGFPCLAFLSNHLETDLRRLAQHGAREVTPVFALQTNRKSLNIALCRGPGDELIELIEFKKN